ncbi:MAG TPA: hypothetical protein VG148_18910 [Pyrinomonadaceae bacterium]|nr:hypothetical protein [Pyrinomonadaceae bacterium]
MPKREKNLSPRLWCAPLLLALLCAGPALAQEPLTKTTLVVPLGETPVKVNVYERRGASVTFVAPHHNEQTALAAAKEAVARKGGRLVEVESFDERGRPARRLSFALRAKHYSVDPNRIFTANGRRCGRVAPEADAAVRAFADGLLKIIFAPGGDRLRDGEPFVVAVHNNGDVGEKPPQERDADLTAAAFVRGGAARPFARGAFQEQAAGVYLSNLENDEDNFVFLSTPRLLWPFAERGFNVVVQKPAAELQDAGCGVDDGSLSVYSARHRIPYVCLEADAAHGAERQRQMLAAVYPLLPAAAAAASTGGLK